MTEPTSLAVAIARAVATTLADQAPRLPASIGDDVLRGGDAIAAYLGTSRRRIFHLCAQGQLPHFREGATLCARRSTLTRWIVDQERAAGSADS